MPSVAPKDKAEAQCDFDSCGRCISQGKITSANELWGCLESTPTCVDDEMARSSLRIPQSLRHACWSLPAEGDDSVLAVVKGRVSPSGNDDGLTAADTTKAFVTTCRHALACNRDPYSFRRLCAHGIDECELNSMSQ